MDTIDLCSGIGGFSKGFEEAGFNVIVGIDNNPSLKKTYEYNSNGKFEIYDLHNGVWDEYSSKEITMIIGSPPCQGYSDIGVRGTCYAHSEKNILRNMLPFRFIDWVDKLQPELALMENVSGFLTFCYGKGLLIQKIITALEKMEYRVSVGLLDSSHYGVPQRRMRSLCVIYKKKYAPVLYSYPFPLPDHLPSDVKKIKKIKREFNLWKFEELYEDFYPKNPSSLVSVEDSFSDLPSPSDGTVNYHQSPSNAYQIYLREGAGNSVSQHLMVKPPKPHRIKIVSRIPEGKWYRSTRFGEDFIGVWDLFNEELTIEEKLVLFFLCKLRTNQKHKQATLDEGFVLESEFTSYKEMIQRMVTGHQITTSEALQWQKNIYHSKPDTILRKLHNDGWLRAINTPKGTAYDVNTKSGSFPRYRRLKRSEVSPTLTTQSFSIRNLVHPTEHRPITLREGARLQSFRDTFEFFGSPREIATMIGNAVPPLLAFKLGTYYKFILDNIDTMTKDHIIHKLIKSKLREPKGIDRWFS